MLDDLCEEQTAGRPRMLVPWVLMTSYLYYVHDVSLISDGLYERLCADLDHLWEEVDHVHREVVDRGALRAGSQFALKEEDYPLMTRGSAARIAHEHLGTHVPVGTVPRRTGGESSEDFF